jgi:Nucleotidyltransferase domain
MDGLPDLPSSLSADQRRVLADVVTGLRSVRFVSAIVLGGSHALGTSHANSDLDIGIYYSQVAPFSIDDIRKVVRNITHRNDSVVTGFYDWGRWVNGGAWINVGPAKVDLLYRNIDQVEHAILEARKGVWHEDFDQQPTYGFRSVTYLAEIDCCIPLYDLHGRIAALKKQVTLYPSALKHTIVSDMLWNVEFALVFARDFARKRDIYNAVGCMTRIANYLTHALFALNETYYLNDKHALGFIDQFTEKPADFHRTLEAVLAKPGDTTAALTDSVDQLARLWNDVTILAADLYKPKYHIA